MIYSKTTQLHTKFPDPDLPYTAIANQPAHETPKIIIQRTFHIKHSEDM